MCASVGRRITRLRNAASSSTPGFISPRGTASRTHTETDRELARKYKSGTRATPAHTYDAGDHPILRHRHRLPSLPHSAAVPSYRRVASATEMAVGCSFHALSRPIATPVPARYTRSGSSPATTTRVCSLRDDKSGIPPS